MKVHELMAFLATCSPDAVVVYPDDIDSEVYEITTEIITSDTADVVKHKLSSGTEYTSMYRRKDGLGGIDIVIIGD